MRDWRTPEEEAEDAEVAPSMRLEAWGIAALIFCAFLTMMNALFG